jgi:hypothetical protein
MLRTALLLAMLFLPLLHACGGPTFIVQQYAGAARPREAISVIRVNGQDTIVLVALDGEDIATRVPDDARLHVEVLPGKHSVTIGDLADTAEPARTASFMAEAGKTYRPVMQAHAARIYEVSPDTDVLLKDVTIVVMAAPLPEDAPAPPAPRLEPPPPPASDLDAGDANVTQPDSGAE